MVENICFENCCPIIPKMSTCSSAKSNETRLKFYCKCEIPSPLRTANTALNKGRKFYGCSRYNEITCCTFFRWEDEANEDKDEFHFREVMIQNQILLDENRRLRMKISSMELQNCMNVRKNRECLVVKVFLLTTWIVLFPYFFS